MVKALDVKKGEKEVPEFINKSRLEKVAEEMSQRQLARYRKHVERRKIENPKLVEPPWLYEVPAITSSSRIIIDKKADITPDIQREVQTYKIALDNVESVLSSLNSMKIKNERPHDYLAEMYKSDTHMGKIRKHLAERDVNIKQSMQSKKWEKHKKRPKKREVGEEKKKLIKKYKSKEKKKGQKAMKPKAPKMMRVKGKRKQKK